MVVVLADYHVAHDADDDTRGVAPTGSSSTNDLLVVATMLVGLGLPLAGVRRRQSNRASA